MKDYTQYQCEDFVADTYFRQWVKQPNEASNRYWRTFLAEYPERAEVVQQAIALVQNLTAATAHLAEPASEAEQAAIWAAVKKQIQTDQPADSPFLVHRPAQHWGRWTVAAASVAALAVGGWAWQHRGSARVSPHAVAVTAPANSLLDRWNRATSPQLVALPDGSSLVLQAGSHIQYPKQFLGPIRTVTLEGEAYFEVAKDAKHPFVVQTSEVTTKVLGTSFNVRAYRADQQVTVTVRSGRVAVFPRAMDAQSRKRRSSKPDSIVLIRNQQLVLARQNTQSAQRQDIVSTANTPKGSLFNASTFYYDATPVSDVFRELERVYGISIAYDKQTLGNCRLTADLTDAPLTEKMTIICKSIEATYTVQANQFAVSGRGCQ